MAASQVVLATGGQSLPKSGSDGAGYGMAHQLGHTIVPTTPGLAPLIIEEPGAGVPLHRVLAGVSQPAELSIWIDGVVATRLTGSLLWTHIGVSGPVAMNASRHWLRAKLEGRAVAITLSFLPGESFEEVDRRWTTLGAERPLVTLQNALAAMETMSPASTAAAIIGRLGLDGSRQLAHLPREDRRRLVHALVAWPLHVAGARGYNYAEVTAGGVSLSEIDPSTMESRVQSGLFLVGEILDVDGRIGGFNFQWAWASGRAAGIGLGRRAKG
jgi:predicted Rossmann fold flavoprotein